MATVASLWVSGPLPKMQELCLSSFIYHGHEVILYTYDMGMDVPKGVVLLDARQIIPESEIFYHHGYLAAFAGFFRLKMILDKNLMWVDADTLCLSEYFFEDKEIVFINENDHMYANGILKIPADHILATELYNAAINVIKNITDDMPWGIVGVIQLDKFVRELGLEHYSIHSNLVNVFSDATNATAAWDPLRKDEVLTSFSKSISATFFNSGLSMVGFDKEFFPTNSAIEYLYKTFVE